MQKARRHPPDGGLRPLVSTRFQVLFHSPVRGSFHLSLTVLDALSVTQEYLALPDGAGKFPQGVSDLAVLRNLLSYYQLPVRSSHALWPGFPPRSGSL